MPDDTILKVRGLCKYYPGVKANEDITMEFKKGEVHALLGENGAGKSTLIKMIAGAIAPDAGEIEINGISHKSLTPNEAKELGVEVIYQEFNLIPQMSCAENVFLNAKTGKGLLVNSKERIKLAEELFERLGVKVDPRRSVGTYSPAYRQIVEIAKAVSRDVKILIMDEPTAPLTVNEVGLLFNIVRQLKESGVTIIFITHRLEELFEISDRVSVMRDGKYIETKATKDTNRKDLVNLMVGRELVENFPLRAAAIGEEVLRVENLTGNGTQDISFTLHVGEILGFAGLVGAGRTEIMSVIYGAARRQSGTIYVSGKKVHIQSPIDAIKHGIGLIPEDRKGTGLFLYQSIAWNNVITALRSICKFGVVDRKKEKEISNYYKEKLQIKTPSLEVAVASLSGGNQQKVVIAKTLAAQSKIIIFDEPTRGIDVGAKQEIYQLMNELAESGHAILMISSEMPELLGMSDRVVVICEGKQTGVVAKVDFSQEHILDLASGEN